MVEKNDWRLMGQEDYMQGYEFKYIKFKSQYYKSLHTHCEFCWHKFMENSEGVEDCPSYGYCTLDNMYWVCEDCFGDFREMFHWKLVE